MKKIELLAPAGSLEILRTAVHAGADAIYIGGAAFSARAGAKNFTNDEMREGIEYARFYKRKLLVAVNTLIKDEEIKELLLYAEQLAELAPDAVIVQDLGVARLLKQYVPELPLHGSTQLTISNHYGVQALKEQGFRRVVVARELTLDEIREIVSAAPDVESEMFIHGAQCFSYSGQCLMSSMIGGRSGNRGQCAQPCRLTYQLPGREGTLLSPKDLFGLSYIEQAINAGVHTLKIEGRLKNRDYVFHTVSGYRQMIDHIYAHQAPFDAHKSVTREITQTFNRQFSSGYLAGDLGSEWISLARHNHKGTSLGRVERYDHRSRVITILLDEPLVTGDGIYIEGKHQEGIGFTVQQMKVRKQEVTAASAGDRVEMVVYQRNSQRDGRHEHTNSIEERIGKGNKVYKSFDKQLSAQIELRDIPQKIAISFELVAHVGEQVRLRYCDRDDYCGEVCYPYIVEQAKSQSLTMEVIEKQLQRLGNTNFYLERCDATMSEGIIVPISVLNELRRSAVDQCQQQRIDRHPYQTTGDYKTILDALRKKNVDWKGEEGHSLPQRPVLIAKVGNIENIKTIPEAYQCIYYDGDWGLLKRAVQLASGQMENRQHSLKVYAVLSAMVKQHQLVNSKNDIALALQAGVAGFVVNQVGQREFILEMAPETEIIFDTGIHCYNQSSYQALNEMSPQAIHLSLELNRQQLQAFQHRGYVYIHGRYRLMISEHSLLSAYNDENNRDNHGHQSGDCYHSMQKPQYLKDRKGFRMPVIENRFGQSEIYNSQVTSLLLEMQELAENCHQGLIVDVSHDYLSNRGLHRILCCYEEAYLQIFDSGRASKERLEELYQILRDEYQGNLTKGQWQRGVK